MTNTTNNTTNNKLSISQDLSVAVPRPKNALVHGVYASEIVLPWESEEKFEILHAELKSEWMPEGRTEDETVLTLARWTWLKHRLMRSTQMASHGDPFVAELLKSGAKTWTDVVAFLQSKAEADDSVMDEAKKVLENLNAALKQAMSLMTASNPDTGKIYSDVELVRDMFNKHVMRIYGKVFKKVHGPNFRNERGDDLNEDLQITAVERAYHPDYLDKLVRLEATIEVRMDKAVQRIVYLKECKRLNNFAAAKKVSGPSGAPASIEK